jgi:hypothetical protein
MKKKSIAALAMAVSLTTLGFASAPQTTPAAAEVANNEEAKTAAAEQPAEAAKEEQKGSATAQNVKEEAIKAAKITTNTKK